MASWRRDRAGHFTGPGLIHHSDADSQYTSFRFTAHLMTAGIDASIGTVGDALDNALMESQIGRTPPSAPSHRTNTKLSITLNTTPANPLEINP